MKLRSSVMILCPGQSLMTLVLSGLTRTQYFTTTNPRNVTSSSCSNLYLFGETYSLLFCSLSNTVTWDEYDLNFLQ